MPTPVLFISGAGLPVWIWDDVRAGLGTASAVADTPRHESASLADLAAAALDSAPWPRFTVIAHSLGGAIATRVLPLAAERVEGFVAVAAVVPKPGTSYAANLAIPARWIMPLALRLTGTRPPDTAIRKELGAGLDELTTDRLVEQFEPEPVGAYLDRTVDTAFPSRRGYISTTRDDQLSSGAQSASAARLQATWTRSLPTAHLPMVEDPAALTSSIRSFLEH